MKINRSSRCSLKFATKAKQQCLKEVLHEYGVVVNVFIQTFWHWTELPSHNDLLKPLVDIPKESTWLTARLRKMAAREAIDMIAAVRNCKDADKKKSMPVHSGKKMRVSSTTADLQPSHTQEFDAWLCLGSIGNGISLDLPIRFHKHYNDLAKVGRRLNSYVIGLYDVQFSFEIITEPKLVPDQCIGIDTGINALASLSTGEQFGKDVKLLLARIRRCKHGSKGQKRASRALRQCIDEVVKQVMATGASLIVVENLKGITIGTKAKGRLAKSMRFSVGRWNVRYWLERLEQACERNRVSFRTVSPAYTSQRCSICGYTDRRNRDGEKFRCLQCDHEDNADVQASRNCLWRFLTSAYGRGCKAKTMAFG